MTLKHNVIPQHNQSLFSLMTNGMMAHTRIFKMWVPTHKNSHITSISIEVCARRNFHSNHKSVKYHTFSSSGSSYLLITRKHPRWHPSRGNIKKTSTFKLYKNLIRITRTITTWIAAKSWCGVSAPSHWMATTTCDAISCEHREKKARQIYAKHQQTWKYIIASVVVEKEKWSVKKKRRRRRWWRLWVGGYDMSCVCTQISI